ncbi:hypothetical protein [Microbacterium lushaniae]|uniref:hypothetical protein n=1 Tax=Microbacterium lushaniae TaxID=2614639 RepID=UPI003B846121
MARLLKPAATRLKTSRSRGVSTGAGGARRLRRPPHEHARDAGSERDFSSGDGADAGEQLVLRRGLEEVSAGTGADGAQDRVVGLIGGEDDHADRGSDGEDAAGGLVVTVELCAMSTAAQLSV